MELFTNSNWGRICEECGIEVRNGALTLHKQSKKKKHFETLELVIEAIGC